MQNMVESKLKELASVDLFAAGRDADTFVGRPFYFDYSHVRIMVNDKWKHRAGGIPAGSFLLCSYDGEPSVQEMVLVRVLRPTSLPSDSDVIASMVEYYKEEQTQKLDSFTRYEFMFSGIECRVLGTFYREDLLTVFGADVENFFSAYNYSAYKPRGKVLEFLVNFREGKGVAGGSDQVRLGCVRYSASQRYDAGPDVAVYVSALDFVGKRTALFGMTRTGKSNTVKKILQCTQDLSERNVKGEDGMPLAPFGQIIFDVNGEYANPNQQDSGTAVYEMYKETTVRYSLQEKIGFQVMKLNFHKDLEAGLGLLRSFLGEDDKSDYMRSFLSISLTAGDPDDKAETTRVERVVAAYRALLVAAGYGTQERIRFIGNKDVNQLAGNLDPSKGLSAQEAIQYFTAVWDNYNSAQCFADYKRDKGRDWADEDLKSVLVMLTRKTKPGGSANLSGFRKLMPFKPYHSAANDDSFEQRILGQLRAGKIVIIDLSQGDPSIQETYSERICKRIFDDGMSRFIKNESANFIQMYFEEAHTLFPKKDGSDLKQIYNRIAKEGAKLRLGLIYATQEVSSISANVLKNTQNWFVSHLNNRDEIREVEKYYDFEDFAESIRQVPERGFIRMKTYSNPFIVPVQIDRFAADVK